MRTDKKLAIHLRKNGKSYKEIKRQLGIPLSTLSNWFSQIQWSNDLRQTLALEAAKLTSRAAKARWQNWRESFREQARKEFPNLMANPLFITGVCLYWGEGDHGQANSHVKLTNTDPRIIALFCRYLRDIINVDEEKIKAWLILYPDLNDKECKGYWSKVSNIPASRFYRSQLIKGRHLTRRVSYGICTVQVNSREIKEKLFTWADMLYNYYKC